MPQDNNSRAITSDDLWSAVRGLELFRKDPAEVEEIRARHAAQSHLFAARVIAEACAQVQAVRKAQGMGARDL